MKSVVKVATAAGRKYVKPFNHTVDSSAGAFQVAPVFYREVQPDGEVHCDDPFFLVYSNPMVVPTLAKYDFNFNKFFVPYKYVWPAWEDYYLKNLHYYPSNAGTPVAPAIPQKTPYITQDVLVSILTNANFGFASVVTDSSEPVDFVVLDTNNVTKSYKWTRLGLNAQKILFNLGYELTWDLNDTREMEILTLFCYGKVYMDYYFPKNYAQTSGVFYNITSAFISDSPYVKAGNGTAENAQYFAAVTYILKECGEVYFNNSELYDAWDNPVAPNAGNVPLVAFEDVTNNASSGVQVVTNNPSSVGSPSSASIKPSNGTPFVGGSYSVSSATAAGVLTGYIQQMLIKVTNFIRRYQLVGNDRIDRWLATFGIKLPDSHRAMHLGETKSLLRISNVNATADSVNSDTSTNSVVGDRGGNGVASTDDLKFHFENRANTHGLFLILMHVTLDNYFVTGIDKMRLMVNSSDRLYPEFDSQGVEMVTAAEVFNSGTCIYNDAPSSFFGFLPRGYAYCTSRHRQSGALRADTLGASQLKAWFPRKYLPTLFQSNVVHSLAFMHPQSADVEGANLPFYDLKYSENFIYTIQFNDCKLIDWKKPLSEPYDFTDDEKNGSVVIENQGSLIH